jgi:hypothetical protein
MVALRMSFQKHVPGFEDKSDLGVFAVLTTVVVVFFLRVLRLEHLAIDGVMRCVCLMNLTVEGVFGFSDWYLLFLTDFLWRLLALHFSLLLLSEALVERWECLAPSSTFSLISAHSQYSIRSAIDPFSGINPC